MREIVELFIHFLVTFARLMQPGGVKAVMAETMATKQQLIVMNRGKKRAPTLTTFDRFFFGFIPYFTGNKRITRFAIIIKPSTVIRFHQALIKRKCRQLYSNKSNDKPGRKGPDAALIQLVIEMKIRNPNFGYGRIAMQIYQEFGITISRFAVGRILRKHTKYTYPDRGKGPSWLTFIGT